MGFYSWLTADTEISISNRYSDRGAFPVYFLIPKEFGGRSILEENYDGYGEFGGINALSELGKWNLEQFLMEGNKNYIKTLIGIDIIGDPNIEYTKQDAKLIIEKLKENQDKYESACLKLGIEIDCEEININFKYPLKIVESADLTYEQIHSKSENCPNQGYFYDN